MGQLQKQESTGSPVMDIVMKQKSQIEKALPKHMNADRMVRIALTECRTNPELLKCEPLSFLGAVIKASQYGLEPGGILGHCYLLPYRNRRQNISEVQFIVGYRGMIELARRSGQIISLSARAVYANDDFTYCFGLDEDIKHIPAQKNRGEIIAVYSVARLKDGGVQFDVMSCEDVNDVRDKSPAYRYAVSKGQTDTPWISSYDEMAKKTVIRRLFKYLPVSVELQRLAVQDEYSELGFNEPIILDETLPLPDAKIPTGKQSLKKEPVKEPEAKPDPKNGKPDDQDKSWMADYVAEAKDQIDQVKTAAELDDIRRQYASAELDMDLIDELDGLCNEIAKEKGF